MRAFMSMERPHRMHGFRSLIAVQTLQPAYRLVPDVETSRPSTECLRPNGFRHDRAIRSRKAIERAAARVVGVRPRAANDDAIDAGRKFRCPAAVESEADEAAQESACDRLRE